MARQITLEGMTLVPIEAGTRVSVVLLDADDVRSSGKVLIIVHGSKGAFPVPVAFKWEHGQ
jgi:hypothetical protein